MEKGGQFLGWGWNVIDFGRRQWPRKTVVSILISFNQNNKKKYYYWTLPQFFWHISQPSSTPITNFQEPIINQSQNSILRSSPQKKYNHLSKKIHPSNVSHHRINPNSLLSQIITPSRLLSIAIFEVPTPWGIKNHRLEHVI